MPPSSAKIASRELDASVGASGPHDFTVRKVSALVFGAACVHRIPSRVRDDREPPLCGTGRCGYKVIWDFGKPEYFCKRGWTEEFENNEVICPSGGGMHAGQAPEVGSGTFDVRSLPDSGVKADMPEAPVCTKTRSLQGLG